jgi:translation initiation factor IF-2
MSEERIYKIRQAMQEFNLGLDTIVEFLHKNSSPIERSPVAKLTAGELDLLRKEYSSSAQEKKEASGISIGHKHNEKIVIDGDLHKERRRPSEEEMDEPIARRNIHNIPGPPKPTPAPAPPVPTPVKVQPVAVEPPSPPPLPPAPVEKPAPPVEAEAPKAPEPAKVEKISEPVVSETTSTKTESAEPELIKAESASVQGLKVIGKIDLDARKKGSKPKTESTPVPAKPVVEPVKKEAKPEPVKEAPKPEPVVPTPVVQAPAPEPTPEIVVEAPAVSTPTEEAPGVVIKGEADQLKGLTVLGKIDLKAFENKPKNPSESRSEAEKRKRKRLKTGPVAVGGSGGAVPGSRPQGPPQDRPHHQGGGQQGGAPRPQGPNQGSGGHHNRPNTGGPGNQGGGPGNNQNRGPGNNSGNQGGGNRPGNNQNRGGGNTGGQSNYSNRQISGQIRATMNRGGGKGKKKSRDRNDRYNNDDHETSKILKLTEFVSVADLASLMDVSVNEVIATCMSLGMFVSINQRLDAEALTIIADEFGFETSFSSAEEEENIVESLDSAEDLETRAPIVTIMGHVDHGKTSLLDYIRKTKVVASEAGGITQHIGAYNVRTESGRNVTFLDTPGHEAFTAMRARGAKVTDVVIIVVAADDSVMPQTKEAINHAQVAGVPIVIAINKIDKAGANPEKIKEELAQLNLLVEDWGGKYQCQEISAKKGIGISELLEKVVLESDILELKANPNKIATGTVIEASLDKGRGYVSTVLVQAGTLKVGDFVLCGAYYGKVKAMYDDTGARIDEAGPSTPVQMLGLNNAPQAGDKFNVMENEREAKELANKREQIQREQSIRTKKHITIDEIGRRIALGTFKELNLIIKGDVDGSVEALADSLLKLSTEEVAVRILHKAVGQISEADVMLASASDAIILGFQVRPSAQARRQAENEEIEIKLYSIIYDAINDIKDAMEGLLAPKVEEVIVGNVEIREVFKISKIGNIAGCYVLDGYIKRNNGIRVIRNGIVIHTGELEALKRYKDDASEIKFGYECGIKIKNFNNFEVGDTIESFEEKETKRSL